MTLTLTSDDLESHIHCRECLIDVNKYYYLVCGYIVFHYERTDKWTFLLGLLGHFRRWPKKPFKWKWWCETHFQTQSMTAQITSGIDLIWICWQIYYCNQISHSNAYGIKVWRNLGHKFRNALKWKQHKNSVHQSLQILTKRRCIQLCQCHCHLDWKGWTKVEWFHAVWFEQQSEGHRHCFHVS